MKQTKNILLLAAILLGCLTAGAQTFEVNGIYYSVTSSADKTVSVKNWSTSLIGDIEIPASVTYNEVVYSVASIGLNAFRDCSSLTSVTIPESVTRIEYAAFYNCTGLVSVTIPRSVTYIGDEAFYYCKSLTSITIPENSKLTQIGSSAFYKCSFTSITIPEGVTSIGDYAFSGCSNLASINIPESATSVGVQVFEETAWYNNQPDGVIYAGKLLYIYKGTMSENTVIEIKEGTVKICSNAFSGYSNLAFITIPESVTSIGSSAFYNCSSLTNITLPEGVMYIGSSAFRNCSSLTSITIPESITSIGSSAFRECSSLTTIAIPEGVTSIGTYTFYGCRSLTAITIPESVTSIGNYAFQDCDGLTTITLPESVTSIGNYAFFSCSNLTSIILPESITSIGMYAFQACSNLTSITIPEKSKLTSIGSSAFHDCSSLTSITIPEGVTSIGNYAFQNCSSLTDIYCYAENVPSSNYAFYKSPIENATLHVPDSALEAYRTTAPWNSFGNIVSIMPENITLAINQYGSGTYCSEYALDFSEVEGLKAYVAAGYDSETGVVTLLRVMTANAGVGLFVKGEPGDYVVPTLDSTSYNALNMLVGTLEETTVNSTDGLYTNYEYTIREGDAEPLFYPFTDGSTQGAGNAYLQIPTAWLATATAQSISYRFDDGETTGIENSKLGIENSTVIYDLMGRRVTNSTKGGIYIVNGRKVVIK